MPGPRKPPNPRLAAAALARRYRVLWARWREHVEDVLRTQLGDARGDARTDARRGGEDLDDAYARLFDAAGIEPVVTRTAAQTARASRQYVAKIAERPVGWSAGEQAAIERFRNENLRLISDLGRDQFVRLARVFRPAQAAGQRWEDVAPQVQQILGIGERHARVIARDQTNKLNAKLNEAHQQAAGVEEYRWRTTRAMSVRGRPDGLYPDSQSNHWHLEGTIQRWDSPPITNPVTGERNHPGEDIQCMCTAEAVLKVFGDGERVPAPDQAVAPREPRGGHRYTGTLEERQAVTSRYVTPKQRAYEAEIAARREAKGNAVSAPASRYYVEWEHPERGWVGARESKSEDLANRYANTMRRRGVKVRVTPR